MKHVTESRFYKPPTEQEIGENGPFIAEQFSRIRAERTESRIFSAAMAFIAGTSLTIIEISTSGFENPGQILSNYVIPSLINFIGQSRTESTQRREVSHIVDVVNDVKDQHDIEVVATESYISTLTCLLEQEGIPFPTREEAA